MDVRGFTFLSGDCFDNRILNTACLMGALSVNWGLLKKRIFNAQPEKIFLVTVQPTREKGGQ